MATIPEVKSEETKMTLWRSQITVPYKKLPAKNIIPDIQISVTADSIDSIRVSKESTNSLTKGSLIKAGLIFLGTVGTYYLAKTTGIFSYFGLGAKTKNSKDVGSSEIIKIKNRANALNVGTNLETARQANIPSVNRIAQKYKDKDRTVKFEEIKVEEFKNLREVEEEKNVGMRRSDERRSISVQNPILDQNAIVENLFELTIDGNSVFSSSSAMFLEATNIPTWLDFPLNPTFKGSYNTSDSTVRVAILGNYAYVVDMLGLQIIDISDPSNPTFKGSYGTPGIARRVTVSGNYAYVADGNSGLQIIDVTNPSNPTFKSHYGTPGSAYEVALSGNYAYVADYTSGLLIIDISDPSNLTFEGSYDMPNRVYGVAVSGNYAYMGTYVGNGLSGFRIIDISDPSNPTLKGSCDTPGYTWGVAVSGNYAYVAEEHSGLQIIDISDPSNPTFKGSYDTPGFYTYDVALSGNYAYVADGGLQIIDISDSSNPTFKGSYNTIEAKGVAISGNYAYVADDGSGLKIIAINSDKIILSGIPNSVETYSVDIKACNEIMECTTDSFDIIVRADLITTLIIISSIIVTVCTTGLVVYYYFCKFRRRKIKE